MNIHKNILKWLEIVLKERFGVDINLIQKSEFCIGLGLSGSEKEILFDNLDEGFYKIGNNDFKCFYWDASSEHFTWTIDKALPALSHKPLKSPLIEIGDNAVIHYDILGFTYYMLNRIEEIESIELDKHSRFASTSSVAYKYDFLERPIVDEWLNILAQVMQKVWPNIVLKDHRFSIKVSHDVDNPSMYAYRNIWQTLRAMAGHIIVRRNIREFFEAPLIRLQTERFKQKGLFHPKDINNTFAWLMDISEELGIKSAFYFILEKTSSFDAEYSQDDIRIRNLLRKIHSRGHEIGLHPGYECYNKPNLIVTATDTLRKIVREEDIRQQELGSRMHYLRWEHPTTLQALNDAGITYDTTLSFADRAGFRCGTCFEYPGFNPVTNQILNIRIRPLIAMECSIISEQYMNLGVTQTALNKFLLLKKNCALVNGVFTLLWHNSFFPSAIEKELYTNVLLR